MNLLTQILIHFLQLLHGLLEVYLYIIFAAVIISWLNADPYNQIVRFIRSLTDPILIPLRRRLWRLTVRLGLDFSPFIVVLIIMVLQLILKELMVVFRHG